MTRWTKPLSLGFAISLLSALTCYAPPVGIWINTSPTSVANHVTAMDIEGGSYDMVGTMWWTNALNNDHGSFSASSSWDVNNIDIGIGDNLITVNGEDSFGDPYYADVTISRRSSPLTYYVSTNGGNAYPYTNWATAARVIQDAVDAAVGGDTVLVSNGVYDAGGRVLPGDALTNRLVMTNAVTVRSVNGSSHTMITGTADPSSTNGPAAVRCVYMTAGSTLDGFSVSNGHTQTSGDLFLERSGGGLCLDSGGTVSNCVITDCTADNRGGGVMCRNGGELYGCTIANSAAGLAGGVSCYNGGLLDNCIVMDNTAEDYAGGVSVQSAGSIYRSMIVSNHATAGGGGGVYFANGGTMDNCRITGNTCGLDGGGVQCNSGGTLNNCLIYNNNAADDGGGAYCSGGGVLKNCTISDNTAGDEGGGVHALAGGTLVNCIVYFNSGDNIGGSPDSVTYTCTTGMGGEGNISQDPMFIDKNAGIYRLLCESPCRDRGTNSAAPAGADLDGNARIDNGTVDMGAYEYQTGEDIGASPYHYVTTDSPDPRWPYTNWITAARTIQEAVQTAMDGDTVLATNGVYDSGGALTPGYALTNRVMIDKAITVASVNGPSSTYIVGASDSGTNGPAAIRCVYLVTNAYLHGFTLTNGYTMNSGEWNLEMGGGGVLLYQGGGVSNCVITDCSAGRQGGGVNMHYGGSVVDCMIRNNHSDVEGGGVLQEGVATHMADCEIHGNTADGNGGGVYCLNGGLAAKCVIDSNTASNDGGGLYIRNSGGSAVNCLITANDAGRYGGGVYVYAGDDVLNCTILNNTAGSGGGGTAVEGAGTLENCIIYFNTNDNCIGIGGGMGPDYSYVCTTPDPGGTGNITNDPQFVDTVSGDYQLSATSPCIDAGTNLVDVTVDLVGMWRPLDGDADGVATADMGCYEHLNRAADSDGDTMPDGFEADHGFNPTDPSDADEDADDDGYDNKSEWIALTDPHDSNSYFHVTQVDHANSIDVMFGSSTARVYSLEGSTNLVEGLWSMIDGATNVPGDVSGTTTLVDTNDVATKAYRVGVSLP